MLGIRIQACITILRYIYIVLGLERMHARQGLYLPTEVHPSLRKLDFKRMYMLQFFET